MASSSHVDTKSPDTVETSTALERIASPTSIDSVSAGADNALLHDAPTYRVYKRRFFGLVQLIVLNIIISWDWLTFSPVSDLSARWFGVSESAINWLSTSVLFAFVAMTPVTLWLLNKGGPSQAIRGAGILVLFGNWIRYGGTRSGRFGVTMFGQIIIGFAQPLVLTAPTRYSNMWFSDRGRVTATAIASLANPFGGALGQLIGPLWASQASQIPDLVLWTAILSSAVALTGLFTPVAPPTPPSASAAQPKLELIYSLRQLPRNVVFWLITVPFVVYVGLFNAISTLLNQIFSPYGYSDDDAGLAGAILIIVGLVAAAITSPIIDRTKLFLWAIRVLVPVVAVTYIALTFMPQTREITGPWIVCAVLGAASFSLLPVVLEFLALVTHPVSPEISSVVVWSGSQLAGAVLILIMDALKASRSADPPYNMYYALVFAAVIACAAWPFPMFIGLLPSTRVPAREDIR